jgi:DnaJ-class molecular chaperone
MENKTCPYCGGRGSHTEVTTELNVAYMPLLGFPMSETKTIDKQCTYCNGTGQVEDDNAKM